MPRSSDKVRVLIYSHDTFGLGHLRRCRAIAHALVETRQDLSVMILSGSPIIGSFEFRSRVDFVRVPGVIKLRNGEYVSLNLHIELNETLAMRASIMRHTAEIFDPDIFIVDKEPLGLRGELYETLKVLRRAGTTLVLGLRDVIDDPALLAQEWERKSAVRTITDFYDEVWIYGLPQICDPLAGIKLPAHVAQRVHYTGYLKRSVPAENPLESVPNGTFILVTPGGGGDGEALVDWVLQAYETHDDLPYPAMVVLGPFMSTESQTAFKERISALQHVEVITFAANLEQLMSHAAGIVAMGGYNTFCEILSFDKPALIVPRTQPRLEQLIRASRARDLGMVDMLIDDCGRNPAIMAAALRRLPYRQQPSRVVVPGLLNGIKNINELVARRLDRNPEAKAAISAHNYTWLGRLV